MKRVAPMLVTLLLSTGAWAEVSDVTESGFLITQRRELPARVPDFTKAVASVQDWWSETHTYSRKAANLRIDARPGGCFCETWEGGAVEHARVIYVGPDAIRLSGALGPLQPMAVTGVLSIAAGDPQGKPSVVITYRVGGMTAEALKRWPPLVDAMMSQTADHLAAYLSKPR